MENEKKFHFLFSGKGSDYFKIWIVNIFLTILTLGIYSAWAKVRTNKWFYGNTILDNTSFSYLATPMQILKGRLIAGFIFIVYIITSSVAPLVSLAILLLLMIAFPVILVLALKFNARYSSYRGLTFDFQGTIGNAYKVYLLYPILSLFTLGLAFPYVLYKQVQYLANNYAYGNTKSSYSMLSKPFWIIGIIYITLLMIPFGVLIYEFYVITIETSRLILNGVNPDDIVVDDTKLLYIFIWYFIMLIVSSIYLKTKITNIFYNGIKLDKVNFESTQKTHEVLWITITNLILIVITFGFFIPFAQVRMAKYYAEHLVVLSDNLDEFIALNNDKNNSISAEISDVFDFDVGI